MNCVKIPRDEIYGYLGYRGTLPDPAIRQQVEQAVSALAEISPRVLWREFPLTFMPEGVLLDTLLLPGKDAAAHLQGCTHAVLMAATLGGETDRLLHRAEVESAAYAVVMQACAAAYIEAVCDKTEAEIGGVRPRYSPGYGDFALTLQQPLLRLLDAEKRLGISVTAGEMLVPTKSVTAVVGLCKGDNVE